MKKNQALEEVKRLEDVYRDRLIVNDRLSRSLVSFQANKAEPVYRWFKYREGFSKALIDYYLDTLNLPLNSVLLDPFAGTGASAFTASDRGHAAIAIELMPVGCYFMGVRQFIREKGPAFVVAASRKVLEKQGWKTAGLGAPFSHLVITKGAFPEETELEIRRFNAWLGVLDEDTARLMHFVLFSVLEDISYTRKDGQYLRWDARAPRTKGSFNKGLILSFEAAIARKLATMIADLEGVPDEAEPSGDVRVLSGSMFDRMHEIEPSSVDVVFTSPPYCNRYDYTRTYALELAYLGVGEVAIRDLRQTLLTCTVENKPKGYLNIPSAVLDSGYCAFNGNACLSALLAFLEDEKKEKRLNNNGIVSMVRGYFLDTAIHLAQIRSKIKPGGRYIMVNDNVQYNGVPVPVDCIVSNLAESLGFVCEKIWVLPIGKGNSSQQMKTHGRNETRKCIFDLTLGKC